MRVAILGDYPIDNQMIRGGVQAAFAGLVRGLSKVESLDTHILTFSQRYPAGAPPIEMDGITIHPLASLPRFERLTGYRGYQRILAQKLAQLKPDLLHAQEATASAYVALRSGYPVVVTVHGILGEDYKYFKSWKQRLRLYFDARVTEQSVMRRLRHLISISHFVISYFAPILRKDLKAYFIPNAVDERFFSLPESPRKPYILFTGRVIPRKRVHDLVQAFAQVLPACPDAHLRIAGEYTSEPAYVDSIRATIHQAGIENNVHLLGQLPQDEVLRELAECGLIALPSSQETMPVAIAQAMAAGKPVVATPVGGVTEMIGEHDERGLLVNVGDVDGLAAALRRLLGEPVLCGRLGQASRAFALENYHPERVARHTFEVYRAVLAEEGHHG